MPEVDPRTAPRRDRRSWCASSASGFPPDGRCALYIRPTMIATDPYLGVQPVGAATSSTSSSARSAPTTRRASTRSHPRRGPLRARGARRHRRGQDRRQLRGQPLPPGARPRSGLTRRCSGSTRVEHRYVEEVGTMNIFFVIDDDAGHAAAHRQHPRRRDARLGAAAGRDLGHPGRGAADGDRRGDGRRAQRAGCSEVFGTGTAAVISPVGDARLQGRRATPSATAASGR